MNTFNKQLWCNDGDRGHTFAVGRYTDAARTNFDVGFYITMAPATSLIASPHTPPPINLYKPANVASTDEQDKYIRSIIVDCLRQLVDDSVEMVDDFISIPHDHSANLFYPVPNMYNRILCDAGNHGNYVLGEYDDGRLFAEPIGGTGTYLPDHWFYFDRTDNFTIRDIRNRYLCTVLDTSVGRQFISAYPVEKGRCQKFCVIIFETFGTKLGCDEFRYADGSSAPNTMDKCIICTEQFGLEWAYAPVTFVTYDPIAFPVIDDTWELSEYAMELIKEAYDTPPTFTI